jgi:hypothetical protein
VKPRCWNCGTTIRRATSIVTYKSTGVRVPVCAFHLVKAMGKLEDLEIEPVGNSRVALAVMV